MPEVIRMLDGTRTIPELEAAFPAVDPEYLRAVIANLAKWGMLEQAADQLLMMPGSANTAAFFRRLFATSQLEISAKQACEYLRDAHVALITTESGAGHIHQLRDLLKATG